MFAEEKPFVSKSCGVVCTAVQWIGGRWALGIALFQLSFGRTPFQGSTPQKQAQRIWRGLRDSYFPADQCSQSLRTTVEELLKKDPAERLPMKGLHALEASAFFQDLDWPALKEQTLVPPFRPQH